MPNEELPSAVAVNGLYAAGGGFGSALVATVRRSWAGVTNRNGDIVAAYDVITVVATDAE